MEFTNQDVGELGVIEAWGLSKRFGEDPFVVDNVSFQLPEGRVMALIGPSGCGKTTTLKMLNRLLEPTRGTVRILGKDIGTQDAVAVRRRIGYVLQGGGLFPHWTVRRNIGLVPRLLGWNDADIQARIDELLELVDLEPRRFGGRFPAELSGGQQQRVGIARALAADPPVVLLDEPFSALDPVTRHQIQSEFLRLKKVVRKTMVFVTHDLEEAFLLADDILLMREGRSQQFGTPSELKERPANDFVKQFLYPRK